MSVNRIRCRGRPVRWYRPSRNPDTNGMTADDTRTGDESEPASKTRRYVRTANLVVRFIVNVVKLVVMLTA